MVHKATLGGEHALYQYMLDISVRDNKILEQANQLSMEHTPLMMQSLPETLNFLQWLVSSFKAKNILEIGSFTGISALAMALVAKDVHITCLDSSSVFSKIATIVWQKFSVTEQIELLVDDAKLSCQSFVEQQAKPEFDLIFLDANKQDYPVYYEYAIQLVKHGGIIVVDNVFIKGRVIDMNNQKPSTQGVRELNLQLLNDDRVILSTLPLADGMTLVTKR